MPALVTGTTDHLGMHRSERIWQVRHCDVAGGCRTQRGVGFLKQHRFTWLFLGVLVFCSVMVVREFEARRTRHADLLEAFILLHTRGYTNQATWLYERLLSELEELSNKELMNDFQRTLMVVDPSGSYPENLVWRYHWTVSEKLENRSEETLMRALKLAEEVKGNALPR
jgi:hypothetical protein